MAKWQIPLLTAAHKARALEWLTKAPWGYVLTIAEPTRNNTQNALMWALLADIEEQAEHCGMKFCAEDWKDLLMSQLRKEMRMVPNLDNNGFVAIGNRTSKLSKAEFGDLIELIYKLGAEKGVVFHEPKSEAA